MIPNQIRCSPKYRNLNPKLYSLDTKSYAPHLRSHVKESHVCSEAPPVCGCPRKFQAIAEDSEASYEVRAGSHNQSL